MIAVSELSEAQLPARNFERRCVLRGGGDAPLTPVVPDGQGFRVIAADHSSLLNPAANRVHAA
jgi:hypothetical protein